MCTTFLGDLGESKNGYPGAIIATMLASEAAFVIEHPEKAKDVEAVYFAGVDGALHGYEAIHLKDASYRLPHLDTASLISAFAPTVLIFLWLNSAAVSGSGPCVGSLRPRPDAPKPRQEIRMTSRGQPNDC